ncbi:MAG TPA: hypothetical protein VHC22_24585 [Pirellulales bacterium]|nr:hypothetical protein [Pirellulales bacterium]
MLTHLLAAGFLSVAFTDGTGDSSQDASVRSAEVRRQISSALSSRFPEAPAEQRDQARTFLKLYADAAALPTAERGRYQLRLKSRLVRLAGSIRKEQSKRGSSAGDASTASRGSESSGIQSTSVRASTNSTGFGGGAQDDGQALVELIEATIAPQSWDVNGGAGTIKYWPAWHVLVVRQTDDVHEQIGGAVHQMRR